MKNGARIGRARLFGLTAGEVGAGIARNAAGCRLQVIQENRPREVEALRVSDPGRRLQVGQFLEGLDAFGDHRHAERLAQRFDRPQNALAARAHMDIRDEGAVDLDLVGGDVGKRR